MNSQPSNPSDETTVSALYQKLLDSWNRRDAAGFAALYDENSDVVGFDGSQMFGRAEIEATLSQIFADHMTATYVSKIRGVRFLAPEVAVLRAVVGMIPPGKKDLNPDANAIQTLVATKQEGQWRIAVFQNTPAQFHGRPELVEALTEELRQLL
jgi:uncharacterized protein (TIGR02246 family)